MRYIYALIICLFYAPTVVAGSPADIHATGVQTGTYNFEIIDWHNANTENLDISLTDPGFINWVGSIGVTVIALVSENVLLSSLVIVILVTFAVVFMVTIIANSKIDANISDMTTDIELGQSLALLTDDDDRRRSVSVDISKASQRVKMLKNNRVNYSGVYGNFVRLNNAKSIKTKRKSW